MGWGNTKPLHKRAEDKTPEFCLVCGLRIKIIPGEEETFPMPDYCFSGGKHN